jgi:hypothetical protein
VENGAPVIISPPPNDDVFVLRNSTEILRVVASDPDGDNLQFFWDPPVFTDYSEETSAEGDLWSSRLLVTYDENLDGQEILLTIADDAPTDPKTTSFSWMVVVP